MSGKKQSTTSNEQNKNKQPSFGQPKNTSGKHTAKLASGAQQKQHFSTAAGVGQSNKKTAFQKQETANRRNIQNRHPAREVKATPLKIFSLGGLNEIGKNIYVYECANDIFIIDCGLAFPDDEMPGVDSVIPDFTYLVNNKEKVRGVLLTHGHEDHIEVSPICLKK